MARLVHLNGPPGIGKSTVAALYVDRHPGVLNLDVDSLHRLIGGWQGEDDTWELVRPLVRAMAATHLRGGRDVVVPQYHARPDEIAVLEELARENGAGFREIVLLDSPESAVERFHRRARRDPDPWVQHHRRLVSQAGGARVLRRMYDDLVELVRVRPDAVVVTADEGRAERTCDLVAEAVRGPAA